MNFNPLELDLSLYVVADPEHSLLPLPQLVKEAILGGATAIQFRSKKLSSQKFFEQAQELALICKKEKVPLIINDRVDIALACQAEGVHLGQTDLPIWKAREMLGPNRIIGVSVHHVKEIQQANFLDIQYISASPVFFTSTKKDLPPPLGIEGLKELLKESLHPVIAIGGISHKNIEPLFRLGVKGVAVISAIASHKNPEQATKRLKSEILKSSHQPHLLAVAGTDPSGSAGLQADLKIAWQMKLKCSSIVTGLTSQNKSDLRSLHPVPPRVVQRQVEVLLERHSVDAIKIGATFTSENLKALFDLIKSYDLKSVVLDPIFSSSSGTSMIKDEDNWIKVLKKNGSCLTLITPNKKEAFKLLRLKPMDESKNLPLAQELACRFKTNVLLKGGHFQNPKESVDELVLYKEEKIFEFKRKRIPHAENLRGTGCRLSSLIAGHLAYGHKLPIACQKAKNDLWNQLSFEQKNR